MPKWVRSVATLLASLIAGGLFVDGCVRTEWHGLFGGLVVAAGACGIISVIFLAQEIDS
jgi:hypothetical protein